MLSTNTTPSTEHIRPHGRGVTLVELIVTLAIFGAVSATLISSFITLFAIRGQSNVTQNAYDDARVVFSIMERELQNAVGSLTPAGCNASVCSELRFEILSGDLNQTIAYRRQNTGIQKAVESMDSAPSNHDVCKGITPTGNIPTNCWQTITGADVTIEVLDFTVEYPAGDTEAQKSPLISIGIRGGAADAANNVVALNFSTSINPRNKILVEQVVETGDTDAPGLTLVSFMATGAAGCSIRLEHPITGPDAGNTPVAGETYYTLCPKLNLTATGEDSNGMLYLELKIGTNVVRETDVGAGTTVITKAFNDIALSDFTRHTVIVRAVDISGNATEQSFTIVRGAPPTAPENISASIFGICGPASGIRVSWTLPNPNFATEHRVYVDGILRGTVGGAATSYDYVVQGGLHSVYVQAWNNLGSTDSGTLVDVPAPPLVCSAQFSFTITTPTGPVTADNSNPTRSATIVYGQQVSLSWSNVTNHNGTLCLANSHVSAGGWSGNKVLTGGAEGPKTPTAGGVLWYTLTCYGTDGSPLTQRINLNVRPAPVTGFGASTACGTTNVTLTWNASGGATGYDLRYRWSGPNSNFADPGEINWTSLGNVLTRTQNNAAIRTWNYYIRATNGTLLSSEASILSYSVLNVPCPPPTVILPTSSGITETGATLGATVSSDGGSPLVERGTCWGLTPDPSTNCTPEGGTAVSIYSHDRPGLTCGTTYYYRGYAINAAGQTGYSASASFSTAACASIACYELSCGWGDTTGCDDPIYGYFSVADHDARPSAGGKCADIGAGTAFCRPSHSHWNAVWSNDPFAAANCPATSCTPDGQMSDKSGGNCTPPPVGLGVAPDSYCCSGFSRGFCNVDSLDFICEAAPPMPTVTLTASANAITAGGTVALTWSSNDAISCLATGGVSWAGPKNVSGILPITIPTAGTYTFSITCSDGTNVSAPDSETVTVSAAAATTCVIGPEYQTQSGNWNPTGTCTNVDDCVGFRPPLTPQCDPTWVTGSVVPFPNARINTATGLCFTRQTTPSPCGCETFGRDCTLDPVPASNQCGYRNNWDGGLVVWNVGSVAQVGIATSCDFRACCAGSGTNPPEGESVCGSNVSDCP